jgi:heavy metal efflux system protein
MSAPIAPPPRTPSFMNRIVTSSLGQPLLVVIVTLLLLGAGTRALDRLPVDAYPDLSPPLVDIVTQWPGHTTEEVERLITVPVERQMNGIPQTTVLGLALRIVRRRPQFY